MKKRKSALVKRILSEGRLWHSLGLIDDQQRRGFEIDCMQVPERLPPQEVRAIRERDSLDVAHFADLLNTSPRELRRWEQGLSRPKGAALRLLQMVRDRGVQAVFLPAHLL